LRTEVFLNESQRIVLTFDGHIRLQGIQFRIATLMRIHAIAEG
jgi:hypothetical protein